MKNSIPYLAITILCLFIFSVNADAQFKSEAFSQNYNDTGQADTTATPMFSLKEYFGGLAHKEEMRIGTMFAGSTIIIGGEQIYQKKYWKLPIIYGGLGATIGLGFKYKNEGNKQMSNIMFAGAGLIYWGTLMDGVITYKKGEYPQAGKATLYSLLLPGLGQAYNGEYWKIPIYWGCLLGAYHFYDLNSTNYRKYKEIYKRATDTEVPYDGPITAENALYYRDVFRRYRDYSVLALVGFYLIQAIDANVFAYMQDFEVTDDLSMKISPTVIVPDTQYAVTNTGGIGLRLGVKF